MKVRRRVPTFGRVFVLGLAVLLAGCAPTGDPGYRDRVEQVARQASGGDIAGAVTALDALAADVSASSAAGTLPAAEADRIATAIDAVRVDLLALAAPSPSATPSPQPSDSAEVGRDWTDKGENGKGKGKGKGRPDD